MAPNLIRPLLALGLALLFCLPARAETPGAYERLRLKAEPVESLAGFLDRFVGRCAKGLEERACRARATKERAAMTGRLFHLRLNAEATQMLQPGSFDQASGEYTFQLTPFFDAGGLGLTAGKPLGLDRQGRPRIALMPLVARLAPEAMPMDMERLLRTRGIRIDLVFKPLGVWRLSPKGKPALEGVRSRFVALRLSDARTGAQIALRLEER